MGIACSSEKNQNQNKSQKTINKIKTQAPEQIKNSLKDDDSKNVPEVNNEQKKDQQAPDKIVKK